MAAAARAVERGDLVPTRQMTYVGLPIGVTRTIHLDRAVTDSEWERLVVALRETFQARGRIGQEGTLRHWSNGNLQALLEPTATGYQLRLSTIKRDARLLLGMGAAALVAVGVMSVPMLMAPDRSDQVAGTRAARHGRCHRHRAGGLHAASLGTHPRRADGAARRDRHAHLESVSERARD